MLKITGYPDRYSAAPGETIEFKISLEEGDQFEARIVRVVHGDCNPQGPGLKFRHVATAADGRYPGRPQRIDAGSYMIVEPAPEFQGGAFTFLARVWPTLPLRGEQTLFAQWDAAKQTGVRIGLAADGSLALTLAAGPDTLTTHRVAKPMLTRQWYAIAVSFDPATGEARLTQQPLQRYAGVDDAASLSVRVALAPAPAGSPILLAGCPLPHGEIGLHFDGKIEAPTLLQGVHELTALDALDHVPPSLDLSAAVIARWDFSREMESEAAIDTGPFGWRGWLVHLPARAMKGSRWTGDEHDWRRRPELYNAIHFHHDDIYDAGWETSVRLTLPKDIASGPYALHVSCGPSDETATREDYLAFFIRPPRDKRNRGTRPKVAFLAPTASYIAYANHGEHITARGAELQMNRLLPFGHADLYLYDHPELGGSLYDCHADGSGVCYSSRLRPVLNFSARYHSWLGGHGSALYQYNADTQLFDWLDHKGVDYDVITDEDLHEEGFGLIEDYRVILTGTHPEYHSTAMWDAMKTWIDRGGRLMYMGGNGWYWRIAFHKTLPGVIEVRRAEDGIRTWAAEPGEYHHSFTGELGGLWRRIGRAPNVICGVGFIAQGFDVSGFYRRAPDADNPRAAFIFEGVSDEIIGDFGLIGGGAAGIEMDCITTQLGSPPNMLRLASSDGHSPMMLLVNEEFGVVPPNLGADVNPRVKADLAFGETPSGGALFCTASIAWCGSLSHNHYDNNVSRITWNTLKRFIQDEPFAP
ncbi:MAG: N,N-dimethylformamidase [Pseudomonadota bacterium]|nr:N,N-dimethylformamidase [Pseudomonadota bacterium]